MIELDGAQGEAGGQALRSALALSVCTRQPFRFTNIRMHRDMPGLLRQHLAAIEAAADISNADTQGAHLGSRELIFRPRRCHAGEYTFALGSGGACSLVLQTVLPALLWADGPSVVRITGCTHTKTAPPFDFLQRAFVPLIERMGARVKLTLSGYGFHPQTTGGLQAEITPATLRPLDINERGARISQFAEAYVANLPAEVAQRELLTISRHLQWNTDQLHLRSLPSSVGKGNAIAVTLAYQNITEVFTGFGEAGVRGEIIAQSVAEDVEAYLARSAPVGSHLADQLLLPMALIGGGAFVTTTLSPHLLSNAIVIQRFTGRRVIADPYRDGYRVTIA